MILDSEILFNYSGGSFGQLRVYYSTDSANLVSNDVNNMGASVLTYFLQPKFGTLGLPGQYFDINGLVGEPAVVNKFITFCEALYFLLFGIVVFPDVFCEVSWNSMYR